LDTIARVEHTKSDLAHQERWVSTKVLYLFQSVYLAKWALITTYGVREVAKDVDLLQHPKVILLPLVSALENIALSSKVQDHASANVDTAQFRIEKIWIHLKIVRLILKHHAQPVRKWTVTETV
jgi:hypothetical protein